MNTDNQEKVYKTSSSLRKAINKYKSKHKEEIKDYNREYMRTYYKGYYEEHKKEILERKRELYYANKEKLKLNEKIELN